MIRSILRQIAFAELDVTEHEREFLAHMKHVAVLRYNQLRGQALRQLSHVLGQLVGERFAGRQNGGNHIGGFTGSGNIRNLVVLAKAIVPRVAQLDHRYGFLISVLLGHGPFNGFIRKQLVVLYIGIANPAASAPIKTRVHRILGVPQVQVHIVAHAVAHGDANVTAEAVGVDEHRSLELIAAFLTELHAEATVVFMPPEILITEGPFHVVELIMEVCILRHDAVCKDEVLRIQVVHVADLDMNLIRGAFQLRRYILGQIHYIQLEVAGGVEAVAAVHVETVFHQSGFAGEVRYMDIGAVLVFPYVIDVSVERIVVPAVDALNAPLDFLVRENLVFIERHAANPCVMLVLRGVSGISVLVELDMRFFTHAGANHYPNRFAVLHAVEVGSNVKRITAALMEGGSEAFVRPAEVGPLFQFANPEFLVHVRAIEHFAVHELNFIAVEEEGLVLINMDDVLGQGNAGGQVFRLLVDDEGDLLAPAAFHVGFQRDAVGHAAGFTGKIAQTHASAAVLIPERIQEELGRRGFVFVNTLHMPLEGFALFELIVLKVNVAGPVDAVFIHRRIMLTVQRTEHQPGFAGHAGAYGNGTG